MTFAAWPLVVGIMLIALVLSGTVLKRLPLSTAMPHLATAVILGPAGWSVLVASPLNHAPILERLTEVAVPISLFSVGLKLGLPLSNWQWLLPLRLAFLSIALTVGLIATVSRMFLGFSLGTAVLPGAILAATDP